MESAILHSIRCLSFSVVYKCRRISSYDLKYTLTSLSSKVDREYSRFQGQIRGQFSFFDQISVFFTGTSRSKEGVYSVFVSSRAKGGLFP